VKFSGLQARIRALAAQIPPAGSVLRIEGGMPSGATTAAAPAEVQLELPLPQPRPSSPEARKRVFARSILDPPEPIAGQPPQADLAAVQALGWEREWWRRQQRRRS
jgi:hypothetical protein